jgi:hypothetical protein
MRSPVAPWKLDLAVEVELPRGPLSRVQEIHEQL